MAGKSDALMQALDQLTVVLEMTASHSDAYRVLASRYLRAALKYRLTVQKQRTFELSRIGRALSYQDVNAILEHSQMARRYASHKDWEGALTHSYQALSALPGDEVSIPIRIPPPPW